MEMKRISARKTQSEGGGGGKETQSDMTMLN